MRLCVPHAKCSIIGWVAVNTDENQHVVMLYGMSIGMLSVETGDACSSHADSDHK